MSLKNFKLLSGRAPSPTPSSPPSAALNNGSAPNNGPAPNNAPAPNNGPAPYVSHRQKFVAQASFFLAKKSDEISSTITKERQRFKAKLSGNQVNPDHEQGLARNKVDVSDESTRSAHEFRKRADGSLQVMATRSSNDVVKKFKLRSNSVISPGTGSLLFEDRERANKEREDQARKKYLITESNLWYQRWKVFMVLCIISQVVFAPVNFAFKPTLSMPVQVFDHLIDLAFFIDFVIHFTVATKDEHGHIRTSRTVIIKTYVMKGTFLFDLYTCFPLDKVIWLASGVDQVTHNNAMMTQFFRGGRIFRLRRIVAVYSLMSYMDHAKTSWFFYSSFAQIAKMVGGICALFFFLNYVSCLWWTVAWIEGTNILIRESLNVTEVGNYFDYVMLGRGWTYWEHVRYCDSKYEMNNFLLTLPPSPNQTEPLMSTEECVLGIDTYGGSDYIWSNYITSMLTALYLLLTGENLEPVTQIEKIVMSLGLLCGAVVVATVFGFVHSTVQSINSRSSAYQNKIEAIYDAMGKMNLPEDLKERIFYYYDYVHMEHGTLNGNVVGFLPEVTKKLQAEIYLWQRFQLINGVPFFQSINPKIIQDMVVLLSVEVYLPGDYVVHKDDFGSTMYFIYTGQCLVMVPLSVKEVLEKQKEAAEDKRKARKSSVTLGALLGKKNKVVDEKWDSESDGEDSTEGRTTSVQLPGGPRQAPRGRISTRASGRASARVERRPSALDELKKKKAGHGKSKIVATLNAGQYFGEVALVLQSKRTASIRSKGISELCVLSKSIYDGVASLYPEDAKMMKTIIMRKYGAMNHTKESVRESIKVSKAADLAAAVKKRKPSLAEGNEEEEEEEEGGSEVGSMHAGRGVGVGLLLTPDRGLKPQGSSTMTMHTDMSTPSESRSVSRENSVGVGGVGVPVSPTEGVKKSLDGFKANMNLINHVTEKSLSEEKLVAEQLNFLEGAIKEFAKSCIDSDSDSDSDSGGEED